MGDSSGQLPEGMMGDSSAGGASLRGAGLAKFRGDDFSFGCSARIPGLTWFLTLSPATRRLVSSVARLISCAKGEKASMLLAALVTGLGPLLFVIRSEFAEDALEESDPDGRWKLPDRCSWTGFGIGGSGSWTGLGTGGASCNR